MKKLFASILLAGLAMASSLRAQSVPELINYQGVLVNAAGTPLTNGDYTISFSIWETASGGTIPIWGPQVFDGRVLPGHGPNVNVTTNGFFNVVLGDKDTNGVPLTNAFAAKDRFLEITIDNGPAVEPRQRILSAPFALKADNTEKLAGYTWDSPNGQMSGARIVDGSIDSSKITNGAVTVSKLDPTIGTWTRSGTDIYYNNGRVGIGTGSPAATLDAQTTVGNVFIRAKSTGGSAALLLDRASASPSNSVQLSFQTAGTSDFAMGSSQGSAGASDFSIYNYGTANNVFTILKSSGNVGIGTTTPSATLHVNGNVTATSFSGSGASLSSLSASGLSSGTVADARLSDNVALRAGGNSFTGNQYITFGNVGIGTTLPGYLLDVRGRARLRDGGGTTAGLWLDTANPRNVSQGIAFFGALDGTRVGVYKNDCGLGWVFTVDTCTGNVGIGLDRAYAEYRLQLPNIADGSGRGLANSWVTYSSQRWKKNIKTIDSAVEKITALRGVSFEWKENGMKDIGFVAEEVGKIFPELVAYEANQVDASGLDYSRLVPVLVEAIKQQYAESRMRDARVSELEEEIARLKSAQREAGVDWQARFSALEKAVFRMREEAQTTLGVNPQSGAEQ